MKSSLVILTANEIEGLKQVFHKIPRVADEIFAVDVGSTDGTIEFFRKNRIKTIIQKKKGRGYAFLEAINHAKGDVIIFFSPDGNEDPADIPKVIKEMEDGTDIVIASRFMKGARSDDAGAVRGFGNKMFTFFVNLFWNAGVTDAVNGFRGVKIKSLKRLNLDYNDFEIEFQMTIRAAKLKYKIKEIPTYEAKRIGGVVKAGTFHVGWLYVKYLLKELYTGNNF